MFYAAYHLWHRRTYKIARRLHEQLRFALVHQVNSNGFREPGYLWKLDAPFVWGPVGGAQNYPWRFLASAGLKGAVGEAIRNVLNTLQIRFSPRVGNAARKAAAFLAATTTNAEALASRRGAAPQVMLETGVVLPSASPARNFDHGGPLRLMWSGVFEHRKALHLLLKALAALPPRVQYELHILGRGPIDRRWRRIARRLNVEPHCRWLGWLDQEGMCHENSWADLFVFTSLRDTSGTVVLEAFGAGTPVLCLDHQGMADIVTSQCGLKLPVTGPREVIAGLRDALLRFHDNRQELARLSRGAIERAKDYCWNRLGNQMAEVYEQVLRANHNGTPQAMNVDEHAWPTGGDARPFAANAIRRFAEEDEIALPATAPRK